MASFDSILFPYASEGGRGLASRLDGLRPLFACVIAWTDTARIPGLSAAGASPELIPFTAAADA
jgi:NaMN:DMB phosphoribosyltransferase